METPPGTRYADLTMPWSLRLVWASALLACCGGSTGDELTSCPPAPLRQIGATCNFEGTCSYSAPHGLRANSDGSCDPLGCDCHEGTLRCVEPIAACDLSHACPLGIAPGDPCTRDTDPQGKPSNAECLFGTDPAGKTASHACACDLPGPIWRCTPL